MQLQEDKQNSLEQKPVSKHCKCCIVQRLTNIHQYIKTKIPKWYKSFTGHELSTISSCNSFSTWLNQPVDGAALGIFRICFGLAMLVDISEERGGSTMDYRFGDPNVCHFPLFDFVKPIGLPFMGVLYLAMWMGAVGVTLGYKFRISSAMFLVPYWYIFLLDKPSWNNHSYLFGLCSFLLFTTDSNRFCSIDYWNAPRDQQVVPFWNYFLIKFQFFILYFLAGIKKLSAEWLSGYAMVNLGYHWVFSPFRLFLSVEMVELLVIHWFAAIFDFSVAFLMTWERTRLFVTPFMLSFHLMNSRLFVIGMFPWVCLAEVQLFFKRDWPRTIKCRLLRILSDIERDNKKVEESPKTKSKGTPTLKEKLRAAAVLSYCAMQFFMPYSHFITKGYNNWTNGLYGYSWDMMVHSYNSVLTSVKIVDNKSGRAHFLEPYAFTEYDRWTKSADMAVQYAKCIKKNLLKDFGSDSQNPLTTRNISIYFDVWCGMNGRFQQRVFDPTVDLLTAKWSTFEKTEWVLPLLNELNHMRPRLAQIEAEVLSWNNFTDVMFVADFPGLTLENFIATELDNVTLTILDGTVQVNNSVQNVLSILERGDRLQINSGELHLITTLGANPSCFMYTYTNRTLVGQPEQTPVYSQKPGFPVWSEIVNFIEGYRYFFYNIWNSIMFLVYKVPMPLRMRDYN